MDTNNDDWIYLSDEKPPEGQIVEVGYVEAGGMCKRKLQRHGDKWYDDLGTRVKVDVLYWRPRDGNTTAFRDANLPSI